MQRSRIFKKLPKNGICAEVGVYEGKLSEKILEISEPKKLYLIDPWEDQEIGYFDPNYAKDGRYEDRYKRVVKRLGNKEEVKIIKGYSLKVVHQFDNEYFDWVFIDADHTYRAVKKDIRAWWPKVKSDGYLCGHDYIQNHNNFGVKKAVDEFIKDNQLKLDILMPQRFACWAIKKP